MYFILFTFVPFQCELVSIALLELMRAKNKLNFYHPNLLSSDLFAGQRWIHNRIYKTRRALYNGNAFINRMNEKYCSCYFEYINRDSMKYESQYECSMQRLMLSSIEATTV